MAPRTTRGSDKGRDLLTSGLELLTLKPSKTPDALPPEPTPLPISDSGDSLRRIAEVVDRIDVEPILNVVRELLRGAVGVNPLQPLTSQQLGPLRSLLERAATGFYEESSGKWDTSRSRTELASHPALVRAFDALFKPTSALPEDELSKLLTRARSVLLLHELPAALVALRPEDVTTGTAPATRPAK